ncbi:EAL domain-containing protein [Roseateles sp. UC29_93]|uniref:EAL domain-containing protein n=1 Tax=Roseateles sp. UC29_93 TaxID=3350177 RepID=UPI00367118C1
MNQALDERLDIEAALRHALSHQLLQLHFQPKVRLTDRALVGVEALLRWHDAERGWVSPDRFIPVAEESGLINALDAWVLAQACAQLARWRAEGIAVPGVSVNVSPQRFHQDDVAAHARALLAKHGLAASDLTLEVTERLMLDDTSRPPRATAAVARDGRRRVRRRLRHRLFKPELPEAPAGDRAEARQEFRARPGAGR